MVNVTPKTPKSKIFSHTTPDLILLDCQRTNYGKSHLEVVSRRLDLGTPEGSAARNDAPGDSFVEPPRDDTPCFFWDTPKKDKSIAIDSSVVRTPTPTEVRKPTKRNFLSVNFNGTELGSPRVCRPGNDDASGDESPGRRETRSMRKSASSMKSLNICNYAGNISDIQTPRVLNEKPTFPFNGENKNLPRSCSPPAKRTQQSSSSIGECNRSMENLHVKGDDLDNAHPSNSTNSFVTIKLPELSELDNIQIDDPSDSRFNDSMELLESNVITSLLCFNPRPLIKVNNFCSWVTRKMLGCMKNGFTNIKNAVISASSREKEQMQLSQMIELRKEENERVITMLMEKISNLTGRLSQMQASNDSSFAHLTEEVNAIIEANKKILEDSGSLKSEVRSMNHTIENLQSKSIFQASQIPSATAAAQTLIPPPPPPPMPSLRFSAPLCNLNATPKTGSPTRKCSTPLQGRPAITVEDLLKVTLKKAPAQVDKENKVKPMSAPRGPVISLDMIRSVKLKSARQKPLGDLGIRSPRSRAMKQPRSQPRRRLSPRHNCSPITSANDDFQLNQILQQVNLNRRIRPKRILHSPSNNESPNKFDLTTDAHSQSII